MFKKILISTDGSELSNQAASAGVDFARRMGAEVLALYVAQPMEAFMGFEGAAVAYAGNYEKDIADRAGKYLTQITDLARTAGVKAQMLTVSSYNAADGIIQAASEEHCDLIFIGSHGRTGLSRLVLGSVSSRVASLSKISTLVYHVKQEA